MKEREINLIDLMVEILLRWRMIIVWMLVGGLALGGFSYIRSKKIVAQQREAAEQEKETADEQISLSQLEESLTPAQKNDVLTVLYYKELMNYYNSSLVMQFDAEKAVKTKLIFWVKADSLEQSHNIRSLYESSMGNGLLQWLQEKLPDQSEADLNELIAVTNKGTDKEISFFEVGVEHFNEAECADLADLVVEYVDFLYSRFSSELEPHEVILADRSCLSITETSLLERQRAIISTIASYDESADTLIKEFSDEEWEYYKILNPDATEEERINEEEESPDAKTEDSTGKDKEALGSKSEQKEQLSAPSPSVKYIILGIAMFAFIYIFYIFIKYIFNNKLHVSDDMREIYDISQLGLIPREISSKRLFGFVDKWILKLRNSNKRAFSEDEAIGLAAVAVKMAVKKDAMNEVFCIGCNVKERSYKIAEQIQDILKNEDIKMRILSNVLYDQEALEQLSAAKCAFLLETVDSTFYNEIEKELELLNRQEIKILGGIVVE